MIHVQILLSCTSCAKKSRSGTTLEGQSHNVCSVIFHPRILLIASCGEDSTIHIWQSSTYRQEHTLNYRMERAWDLAATPSTHKLVIGFDEGCVVVDLGSNNADEHGRTASVKGLASAGKGV